MTKFKKPIKAVWKNRDYDQPVNLTGFSICDGEYYFSIEGSKTGIPYKQVLFEDKADHIAFLFLSKYEEN